MKSVSLLFCILLTICHIPAFGQYQPDLKDIVRQIQGLDAQVTHLYDQAYYHEAEIELLRSPYTQRLKNLKDDNILYTGWAEYIREASLPPDKPINAGNASDYIQIIFLNYGFFDVCFFQGS